MRVWVKRLAKLLVLGEREKAAKCEASWSSTKDAIIITKPALNPQTAAVAIDVARTLAHRRTTKTSMKTDHLSTAYVLPFGAASLTLWIGAPDAVDDAPPSVNPKLFKCAVTRLRTTR